MERQDITTLVSHHIPNEQIYRFDFPYRILKMYNGLDNIDNTWDNLMYSIINPLVESKIE